MLVDVAAFDEVENDSMLKVQVLDRTLCLIKIEEDIYIIDDRCSHADFSLSEGMLDVGAMEVECPKHGALFDVKTGEAKCLPATSPVEKYDVVVENGRIFIDLDLENA